MVSYAVDAYATIKQNSVIVLECRALLLVLQRINVISDLFHKNNVQRRRSLDHQALYNKVVLAGVHCWDKQG